jgi:hypothetical protein
LNAAIPPIEVPGAAGLRDLVWNLDIMLKEHHNAFLDNAACLTGIYAIISGLQFKKHERPYKNNRVSDVDPDNSYTANLLVDGEWGMMSAGNILVVARGIMELYNRVILHAQQGEHTITSRDIIENSDAKKTHERKTEQKSTGGESYLARTARETARKSSMCCNLQAGLHVHRLSFVGNVKPIITRDKVKIYGFNDKADKVAVQKEEGEQKKDKETVWAWKSVCQGMIREDFESSLEFVGGSAKHVLEQVRPEIGHTTTTSRESYLKPPVALRFQPPSLRGKKDPADRWAVLDLRESCNTMCTLLSKGDRILKCGDFGINTNCKCSMAATTYRSENQKEWMRRLENTRRVVPEIDDDDPRHLLRLAFLTKVGVRELIRPIPKLHARWPTNFQKEPYDERTQNALYVDELSKSCNMMTNEVVRIIRDHHKMPVAEQSATRLLGVSCCPMMAAKMFGAWAYHLESIDEQQYSPYFNRRSPNHEVSAERLVLIQKRVGYMNNQTYHVDAEVLLANLRTAKARIAELEKENEDLKSTVAEVTEKVAPCGGSGAHSQPIPTTDNTTKVRKGEHQDQHHTRKRAKQGDNAGRGDAVSAKRAARRSSRSVEAIADASDASDPCKTFLDILESLPYNKNAFYGHDRRCKLHPAVVKDVVQFVDDARRGTEHHLSTFCTEDDNDNSIEW